MRLTTLCYIEKDGKYLMLHRTKKKNDENHDKWIGVGGKFEPGMGGQRKGIVTSDMGGRSSVFRTSAVG